MPSALLLSSSYLCLVHPLHSSYHCPPSFHHPTSTSSVLCTHPPSSASSALCTPHTVVRPPFIILPPPRPPSTLIIPFSALHTPSSILRPPLSFFPHPTSASLLARHSLPTSLHSRSPSGIIIDNVHYQRCASSHYLQLASGSRRFQMDCRQNEK